MRLLGTCFCVFKADTDSASAGGSLTRTRRPYTKINTQVETCEPEPCNPRWVIWSGPQFLLRNSRTTSVTTLSTAALQARVRGQLKLVQYRVELHDVSTFAGSTQLRTEGVEMTPAADPKQGTPKVQSDEESRPWHALAGFCRTVEGMRPLLDHCLR